MCILWEKCKKPDRLMFESRNPWADWPLKKTPQPLATQPTNNPQPTSWLFNGTNPPSVKKYHCHILCLVWIWNTKLNTSISLESNWILHVHIYLYQSQLAVYTYWPRTSINYRCGDFFFLFIFGICHQNEMASFVLCICHLLNDIKLHTNLLLTRPQEPR